MTAPGHGERAQAYRASGRATCGKHFSWLLMLFAATVNAQPSAFREPRIASARGHDVLVLAPAPGATLVDSAFGALAARTYDTSSRRVHEVTVDGATYRASTPLEGSTARIAFDPSRGSFVELLPSLRVELGDGAPLETVVEAVDAVRVTRFDALGFAIVELPDDLHPAAALARLTRLPDTPAATLRLRGPDIEWR